MSVGAGISQLNPQNLGGFNAANPPANANRRSLGGFIGSDAGSVYRAG